MVDFIDVTNNILSQNSFCFDTKLINYEQIPVPIENAYFGILNFKAVTSEETKDILELLFTIDCSGSMSDICSDGKSKMVHIIHTLKNMILFLSDCTKVQFYITINAFDSKIYKIVERTRFTEDNLTDILIKINKIVPLSSTNIENALINAKEHILSLKEECSNQNIKHIFMTDGQATEGNDNIESLKELIVDDIMNAFIGFGIDHDSVLLNAIGSVGKSSYHFIDKLENAGLIYGEILHSIVYELLSDAEIIVKNGLIYDFKTNQWTDKLLIGNIISEANKIYNICSTCPNDFEATIKAKDRNILIMFPANFDNDYSLDFTNHQFRQRTLQLMYKVIDYCKKKREYEYNKSSYRYFSEQLSNSIMIETLKFDKKKLKKNLRSLMDEIKEYMVENQMIRDKFMKNLCDDIYVCFRTFDTKFGNMYCTSRQSSQGTQRQYTATQLFDDEINDDLRSIMEHELSDFNNTPYLSLQATQVMKFMNSSNDEYESNT